MRTLIRTTSTRTWIYLGLATLLLLVPGQFVTFSDHQLLAQTQQRQPAPDLEGGVAWLNTDKALPLAELRGRIVLLDFWTLC